MNFRLRRTVFTAFVILIAAVFAVFFGRQQGSQSGGDVAEVAGQRIRRDVFEAFRQQNEQALEGLIRGLSRKEQGQFVDHQTLDGLIRRSVLRGEAVRLGLEVTNPELTADLQANPEFQQDGRFQRERVEQLAAALQLSVAELLEELRTDALLRKFQRLVTSPVRVSRAEVRWDLVRSGEERSLVHAAARTADFESRVQLAEGAPRELVEKDRARVQAVYDARRADYQQPEQVRAEHILFAGDDAEARARAAAARLEAGEPFDKLARELSDDAATASLGGDLGWFPRGILAPEIDAVVFEQLEPGNVSAPVKTERGWHLVRLEEKRAAQERSFEQVAEELAREILVREQAAKQAHDAAAQVLEAARASGDLGAAARQAELPVTTSGLFKRSDSAVPGLGSIPGLVEIAFALDASRPVATEVYQDGDQYYAIALAETRVPGAEEIDAKLDAEIERSVREERERTSALWYGERRRELQEDGDLVLFPLYEQ
jgi:peptidyl-prolyl cis-trans isomerase D